MLLLAIPSGIVTVGAHVDQSIGPGGCRGFDIDLQGKHMWAPEVPCVEVGTGGVTEPWKVALLGVAREAGDAAGDHLHVCVGLTIPQRTKDGGIPQFLQPAFTLVHENVTRSPVAEIAPGKKGFRCGLRRTVSWPGTVIDVVFQVPTAEQNHRLVISGSPPGVLDLDGLSY